jgi:hypothetical protein
VGIAQAFIGDIVSIILFALVATGIMKVFQIATDVREMKDALMDIKRNTQDAVALPVARQHAAPPTASELQRPAMTPEELVRAVHSRAYRDDEFSSLEPTAPPQS